MSPIERLTAESVPDGTFGQAQPQPARRPWTREEQDAHWNDLAHTLGAYKDMRPTRRTVKEAA